LKYKIKVVGLHQQTTTTMANQKQHLKDFRLKLGENDKVLVKYLSGISCGTTHSLTFFPVNVSEKVSYFKEFPKELQCKKCLAVLNSRIADIKEIINLR
jgi:hypothetical protein